MGYSKQVADLLIYDSDHPNYAGTDMEEKLLLYSILRYLKPERVIEIGVSCGHATAWIAMALLQNKKGRLSCVDNFKRRHGGMANSQEPAKKRLSDNGILSPMVKFVVSDSKDFLKKQPDNSVDIIVVDGDHSYAGALVDIYESCRIAKHLVIVHDSNQFPEVRDACLAVEAKISHSSKGTFFDGRRGYWIKDMRNG